MKKRIEEITFKVKTSFFDYYKLILSKVSFDVSLLNKEYQKALEILQPNEVQQLESWLMSEGLYYSLMPVRN